MFIRSENLFLRPAWPEDLAQLAQIDVPGRHDAIVLGLAYPTLVTLPQGDGKGGARVIGIAGFSQRSGGWAARLWLAPAWRNVGLFDEAEDALADLARNLPQPDGTGGFDIAA